MSLFWSLIKIFYRKDSLCFVKESFQVYRNFSKSLGDIPRSKIKNTGVVRVISFGRLDTVVFEATVAAGLAYHSGRSLEVVTIRPIDFFCWLVFKKFSASVRYVTAIGSSRVTPKRVKEFESLYESTWKNGDIRLSDLKAISYAGIAVGSAIATELVAGSSSTKPLDLSRVSPAKVRKAFMKICKICDTLIELSSNWNPSDTVIVCEANGVNQPLSSAAIQSGCDVIQFCQPFDQNGYVFKRIDSVIEGASPNSVERLTVDRLLARRAFDNFNFEKLISDRYCSKEPYQRRNYFGELRGDDPSDFLGFPKAELPLAVVYVHCLWDGNLFFGRDLFDDYTDWFRATYIAARENSAVNWVFKLHPANIWKTQFSGNKLHEPYEYKVIRDLNLGSMPQNCKFLEPDSPVNTYDLLRLADVAVTVRGTAGLEAACMGSLVITAGSGRYSHEGFSLDPELKGDYLSILRALSPKSIQHYKASLDWLRAKYYAKALFEERKWMLPSCYRNEFIGLDGRSNFPLVPRLDSRYFCQFLESLEWCSLVEWIMGDRSLKDYMRDW